MSRAHRRPPAIRIAPMAGRRESRLLVACAAAFLVLSAGCRRAPAGWTPVLERTSTEFLQRKVADVAAAVERARDSLEQEPQVAAAELQDAADTLTDLLTYYLPLLEAREGSYNAYRHLLLGETGHARQELDRVEKILLEVARTDKPAVAGEMTLTLQELERTRVAIDTGSDQKGAAEARTRLEQLAAHLDQLALKGGLVLDE